MVVHGTGRWPILRVLRKEFKSPPELKLRIMTTKIKPVVIMTICNAWCFTIHRAFSQPVIHVSSTEIQGGTQRQHKVSEPHGFGLKFCHLQAM
jgi:hypothetical protein